MFRVFLVLVFVSLLVSTAESKDSCTFETAISGTLFYGSQKDLEEKLSDGYCDQRGDPVWGLITYKTWVTSAPVYSTGDFTYYNPGIMEDALSKRASNPSEYVDGIALMSCEDVGKTAYLRRPGNSWEGPFLVSDCAQRQHVYSIVYYFGVMGEVGCKTANLWGMVTSCDENLNKISSRANNVEICVGNPSECVGQPVNYVDWWTDMARFTNGVPIHGANYKADDDFLSYQS